MEKFKSKIGLEWILVLLMVLGVFWPFSLPDFNSLPDTRNYYENLVFLFILGSLSLDYIFRMQYTVDSNRLKIKGGIFYSRQIKIEQIRSISETKKNMGRNTIALSSDGLEIEYYKSNELKTVFISPKEKAAFINAVKKINAAIEVKSKI